MSRLLVSASSLALALGTAAPVLAQAGGCTFGQSWDASGGCSYEDRQSGEDAVQRTGTPGDPDPGDDCGDDPGDGCGDPCGDGCGDGCGDDSAMGSGGEAGFLTLADLQTLGLV